MDDESLIITFIDRDKKEHNLRFINQTVIQDTETDATIYVNSIDNGVIDTFEVYRNGVINGYDVVGAPDFRSPYRNSQNPWPVMSISDGGANQYDRANFITTDKSITEFIGSIEQIDYNNGDSTINILTVTEIISGTISVGQSIRHNLENYRILTGTLNGGVGTYSVSDYYINDRSEQVFKAYGFNKTRTATLRS